jgi:hypothetical protein
VAQQPAASAIGLPSRRQALGFWLRSRGLMLRRLWRDAWVQPVPQWPAQTALRGAPVLAEHRSALWRDGRSDEEFGLVAGKVHNLRLAVRAFHGVEVAAGGTLSFWRQLGRLSARRGFVLGREVREGCVVPALGGGLCQLSNALATCAARAGFTLVERHGHTRRIEQSQPPSEADAIDATVFWNYVDLRVQAGAAWRLEAELTADELVVRLRGVRPASSAAQSLGRPVALPNRAPALRAPPPEAARGCLTCEQTQCFRHRPDWPVAAQGRTALLLDAWTPEFEAHVRSLTGAVDAFVPRAPTLLGVPVPGRAGWQGLAPHATAWAVFFARSAWSRWHARRPGRRQAAVMQGQHALALAYARRLRPQHTHLVVDQALLVPLWRGGHLAGRRYEVLMHSLPMREIHARLQAASRLWPDDPTLRDFRADPAWLDAEDEALRQATALVTPHRDVARLMQARHEAGQRQAPVDTARREAQLRLAPWVLPAIAPVGAHPARPSEPRGAAHPGPIVFGASALGRKGLHELAAALQGWPGELWVLGSAAGEHCAWQGLRVRHVPFQGEWWRSAALLVLPAHVEHAPRAALKALAAGVPVVASTACGIEGLPGVHSVAAGDIEGLRRALAPWTGRHAAAANPAAPAA